MIKFSEAYKLGTNKLNNEDIFYVSVLAGMMQNPLEQMFKKLTYLHLLKMRRCNPLPDITFWENFDK
ncbi:17581_t:CDS:2 [Rhizophagus irregularis]|nr:17581_t:CDS:2 [Rhizophagus irregularis]